MEKIQKPWQASSEAILRNLESQKDGLDDFEAQKRLFNFGFNTIGKNNPIPFLKIFFHQFIEVLVIMLIFAAVLSFFLGDPKNGYVLSIIVIVNAIIGFSQEYKAEKIIRALTNYLPSFVKIKRAGIEKQIDSRYLVPGDIVILGEGDKVPADIRILEAYDFFTNEQSLTGESNPQDKIAKDYLNKTLSIVEAKNSVFMGTVVTQGEAMGIVTSTGLDTEFGKIAKKTTEVKKSLSPLEYKIAKMSKKVVIIAATLVIGLVVYKYFHERNIIDALIYAVAVAAALVPEGLPATISVSLSLGARNLAKKKALVRNLVSVETLGSVTVICTDKTGTLTTGKMEVKDVWDNINSEIKDEEKEQIINELFILCSDSQINKGQEIGDPTEIALLKYAQSNGYELEKVRHKYHKINEIPFNSKRRFMSITLKEGEKSFTLSKGAPEVIMEMCEVGGKDKEKIQKKYDEFATEGYRVLGLSYNNIFLGLVAIFDPPRLEVKDAIKKCREGGIRVIMITGDNSITAASVAKMVGLYDYDLPNIIDGNHIQEMSDLELRNILQKEPIFSRALPEQKYRIVDNLMKMGEVVAVTGDGVNDAPALKKSDIGIAMGKVGTDVSREAADMILLDDNFQTIVEAVEEGRAIFDNIKKFLFYIFSHNFGELLTVVFGIILGLPLPITAILILAIDLGTDVFPSMSLIGEPPEKDVISTKPRSKQVQLLSGKSFIHLSILGIVIGLGAIWNFSSVLGSTGNYQAATTASLATIVISQIFNLFLARCPNISIFKYQLFSNKWLIGSALFSLLLIFTFIYYPVFSNFLRTDSFSFIIWMRVLLVGVVLLVVEEFYKYIRSNLNEKKV